ncbi:MAG: hypothetical protein ACRD0A_00210 [Acidimicrobiales bacterium]
MGALMATRPPAQPRSPARRRAPLTRADIIRRLLITVVVLACIGGLVIAVQRADTGEPDSPTAGAPDIIEFLVPAQGSEVLQQANVAADLAVGWTGTLVINGTEIPEDQLFREPAQNIVEYRPGEGRVIEQLPPGRNCAQVITWRVNESRERARAPVEWCFEAT